MDTYSRLKAHEARIAALESPQIVDSGAADDTPDLDSRIIELAHDLDQLLDRLTLIETRCDEIAAVIEGMELGRPGGNEEESE
jgi:hypothetical protein